MRPNTLTVILRDDEPCGAYGGPAKYRSVHVTLTAAQLTEINQKTHEDVERCFFEVRYEQPTLKMQEGEKQ